MDVTGYFAYFGGKRYDELLIILCYFQGNFSFSFLINCLTVTGNADSYFYALNVGAFKYL